MPFLSLNPKPLTLTKFVVNSPNTRSSPVNETLQPSLQQRLQHQSAPWRCTSDPEAAATVDEDSLKLLLVGCLFLA